MQSLKSSIERLAALGEVEHNPEARPAFLKFRDALTQGKIRAAEKIDGHWTVNTWVKHGILLGFRLGELVETGCTADRVDNAIRAKAVPPVTTPITRAGTDLTPRSRRAAISRIA